MSGFRSSPDSMRLAMLLLASCVAQGVVLYFGPSPSQRLGLGILMMAPIVWAAAKLGVLERLTRVWGAKRYQRRFLKLRGQVDKMIEEVRRMNWAAFDHRRGLKSDEAAKEEMDAIEERLVAIIRRLRTAAGEMSEEEEDINVVEEIASR